MISSPYVEVHKSPNGPGDARPTALKVVEDMERLQSLNDKVMLVTGGTSGIGLETARALQATGAKVYITARQMAKGAKVAAELSIHPGKPVEVIQLELDSFDSIETAARDFLRRSETLNVLVCNAGIMAPPESRTREGFELQFGTNYLGHFLLFQLLKPTLMSSSASDFASRTIAVSSCAHRNSGVHIGNYNLDNPADPYNNWKAYGQSKSAMIYFCNEIERRYKHDGLHGLSLHPGFIHTDLERFVSDDPQAKEVMSDPQGIPMWKTAEQGAATTTWAAIGRELEGIGGLYLDDVQVAEPYNSKDSPMFGPGYAPHAYDVNAATQLWEDSLRMTVMQDKFV